MTLYYIIETNYTWINDFGPKDTIEITTIPAHSIWTGEAVINGGTGVRIENGYEESEVAHGEYETLEAAQDAITEIFGEVREANVSLTPDYGVEIYFPGLLDNLTPAETRETIKEELLNEGAELAYITDTDIPEIVKNIDANFRTDHDTAVDKPACAEVIREIREEQRDKAGIE